MKLVWFLLTTVVTASLSSSSSRGMVDPLTMLADRKLARDDPLLAELPVLTTDSGDMQLVRPLRELRPLSLLLWLWLTTELWSLLTSGAII